MNNDNNNNFNPNMMPNNNDNGGNNFNPNNNGFNPDELRQMDEQMGNMPGPNEGFGFNNMNNQNNFNNNMPGDMNNNMPDNNMNMGNQNNFNNMNNQNNFNNNMPNNNSMGYNNMNNQGNYAPYNAPMRQGGSNNTMLYIIIGVAVLAVVAVVVFLLLRSGGKTLKCSGEVSGAQMEMTFPVKNDKVSSGTMTVSMDLNEMAKEYGASVDDIDPDDIKICDQFKSNAYLKVKSCNDSYKNGILSAKIDIEFSSSGDVEQGKKAMEAQGLTCKY